MTSTGSVYEVLPHMDNPFHTVCDFLVCSLSRYYFRGDVYMRPVIRFFKRVVTLPFIVFFFIVVQVVRIVDLLLWFLMGRTHARFLEEPLSELGGDIERYNVRMVYWADDRSLY